MRATSSLAIVAIFTALIVGSDFALTPFVNFKLLDTMVFVVAFAFGFRLSAAVAILSETVWSIVSPWGAAGPITPFLVAGELIFAAAGWAASRTWKVERNLVSPTSLFIGATLAICAFAWDLETNAATALIWYWPELTLSKLLVTEMTGFPFALAHELGDLLLGMSLAPAAILVIPKVRRNG